MCQRRHNIKSTYISSFSSRSLRSRCIASFFRVNASSKYSSTLLISIFNSSHFIFRRIDRHSWFIFAKFKRENASSRFNLFYKIERHRNHVWNFSYFENSSCTFMKIEISCCFRRLASSSISALCCRYRKRSSSDIFASLFPAPFFLPILNLNVAHFTLNGFTSKC